MLPFERTAFHEILAVKSTILKKKTSIYNSFGILFLKILLYNIHSGELKANILSLYFDDYYSSRAQ